jgi:eukaryotic-like serine/threonine-protein kinase
MPDLREVEIRIAVAEGALSRAEADALAEEARRKKQSPLALLVERGRLSEDSFQSFRTRALNDPALRAAGKDASASTYTMQAGQRPSDEPAFPVTAWDRYVNVRFLGQGGMGMVFLANDTRLRREVAIKFVRGDDAEHVRRLIVEARMQAQVSHERICKVYEVDEVEGKVYIAMQYIEGTPLGKLAGEFTLEQKVRLVCSAAEGLHEAHRAGIVHRDIKPSNIMVERSEDGELRPYVMDFGLARSAQEAGTTQTGAVLGTPRYMAPEQAQGDTAKLDRRADVYSLGATLYHLITGEPAVPGETVAEVIHNLMSTEPRPLRAHDPSIPIDLEAIVLKCLEKDRSRRYDSARALADDLSRFLDGEPVLARPADTWYWLRKRLAKHRRLAVASAAALVVLAVAIGWAIKTRLEAAERESLARRFTEQVEQIEAVARYSALSPRHDITGDRAEIRTTMKRLETDIEEGGDVAAGPGHYALGRGYLALDDNEQARRALDQAWTEGYHEPRVAFARALAFGRLYQRGLLAAERIEDQDRRQATKRRIEKEFRDPALRFLAASDGAEMAPSEYVAALGAFYGGDLDEALDQVDKLGNARAWHYETPKLRGDILFARALKRRDHNEREQARSDFDAGRAAYAAASAIGRSVPAVYESLADLEHAVMVMELYGDGDAVSPAQRALSATGFALEIAPDHYEALVLKARVQGKLAEHHAVHGGNVEELLGNALVDAKRALAVSPTRPEATLEILRIHRQWGDHRNERHENPIEQFQQAVAVAAAIPPDNQDTTYFMNLGATFAVWATYEDEHGANGQAHRDQSIDHYKRAIRAAQAFDRKDQLRDIRLNVALILFERASAPHAVAPDADLQEALKALGEAKDLDRTHFVPYYTAGQIYEAIARRDRARGSDPDPALTSAMMEYRAGLAIKDESAHLHTGVGAVFVAQVPAAWDRGDDPGPLLMNAQAAFQRAIALDPTQGHGQGNLGEVYILRAAFERSSDADPTASVNAAVQMLNQAIANVPHPTFRANLAMAYTIVAGYYLEHGRDPQPSLDQAAAALAPVLRDSASHAQVQLYLAEIQGLGARVAARNGRGAPADFARTAHAFENALTLATDIQDSAIVFGMFCRAWAGFLRETGRDPEPALARGFMLADQILKLRPRWPDALVLRASLTLVAAQQASDVGERRRRAEHARKDFDAAFATQRALQRRWAAAAAQAQQLAR